MTAGAAPFVSIFFGLRRGCNGACSSLGSTGKGPDSSRKMLRYSNGAADAVLAVCAFALDVLAVLGLLASELLFARCWPRGNEEDEEEDDIDDEDPALLGTGVAADDRIVLKLLMLTSSCILLRLLLIASLLARNTFDGDG